VGHAQPVEVLYQKQTTFPKEKEFYQLVAFPTLQILELMVLQSYNPIPINKFSLDRQIDVDDTERYRYRKTLTDTQTYIKIHLVKVTL
jgi:hypothetical protein